MDRLFHLLVLVIGIVLGAAGMYIGYPYIKK
jgi:Ni,Fe-hydrogenase I cytochrome b subunit